MAPDSLRRAKVGREEALRLSGTAYAATMHVGKPRKGRHPPGALRLSESRLSGGSHISMYVRTTEYGARCMCRCLRCGACVQ